jgi:hypothetical protein
MLAGVVVNAKSTAGGPFKTGEKGSCVLVFGVTPLRQGRVRSQLQD